MLQWRSFVSSNVLNLILENKLFIFLKMFFWLLCAVLYMQQVLFILCILSRAGSYLCPAGRCCWVNKKTKQKKFFRCHLISAVTSQSQPLIVCHQTSIPASLLFHGALEPNPVCKWFYIKWHAQYVTYTPASVRAMAKNLFCRCWNGLRGIFTAFF